MRLGRRREGTLVVNVIIEIEEDITGPLVPELELRESSVDLRWVRVRDSIPRRDTYLSEHEEALLGLLEHWRLALEHNEVGVDLRDLSELIHHELLQSDRVVRNPALELLSQASLLLFEASIGDRVGRPLLLSGAAG